MDHSGYKKVCFQFTCRDGPLVVDADPLKDLFPPISPVAVLLSDRWPAAAAPNHCIELQCRPYSTHTIRLVLDALQSRDQSLTEIASQLWQCRHEFVSACDFLLLAGTDAGRLAADLLAISAHTVIDICHDLPESGDSPHRPAGARVSVSVGPHTANFPPLCRGLYGPTDMAWPPNEWTTVATRDVTVSSLSDLVDVARTEAAQWSIMSPRDFSCAAASAWSPIDVFTARGDAVETNMDSKRNDDADSDEDGVVVFQRRGVCFSTVVVGLNDVPFLDPADAIAQSDRRDPVCALALWAPPERYHRGTAILVVGGTPQGRLQTASAMARAMRCPKVVVHKHRLRKVDRACFGDALASYDPPVEPDRKTVIIVPESFSGDKRRQNAIDNVYRRHCSAVVTSVNSGGWGNTLAYHTICVLVHPDTDMWTPLLLRTDPDTREALLRSCSRRAVDSGATVCLVATGRGGLTVYSPDSDTAVGPCDRCAGVRAKTKLPRRAAHEWASYIGL
ncbi:hypothetical protein TW95_gp0851 [Pandoravirus inopinatum]|uniref:Uncharacterized protein n=1 Tax=Pandoravirus inopinatum TaxID=1605721 RepID=A0A0B5J6Z9_9VIRU|nr:hypothetical protein TW95_gp0851 [Pandoravirus inopinatum]AJF97585.1 hypothetical protein [Pandoravirus inopinatum]